MCDRSDARENGHITHIDGRTDRNVTLKVIPKMPTKSVVVIRMNWRSSN